MTAGASRRVPLGQAGDRQPEPDDRAEDEEEAQVVARRQPAPADDQRLAGFDGERRDDGAGQPEQSEAEGPRTSCAQRDRQRRGPERDDDEDDQAHVGSIGWASAP